MAVHDLLVEEEAGIRIADQHMAVLQSLKVLDTLRVDGIRIDIDPFGQIDFRARDVQKTIHVIPGEDTRLLGIDDVIRNGRK